MRDQEFADSCWREPEAGAELDPTAWKDFGVVEIRTGRVIGSLAGVLESLKILLNCQLRRRSPAMLELRKNSGLVRERRLPSIAAVQPLYGFAQDSPLEGSGFELLVPLVDAGLFGRTGRK